MQPADDFQSMPGGLSCWQGYDPSVKTDLSSTALEIEGELYFIDPIPLAAEPLEMLVTSTKPAGIILTSGNHERAAAAYRNKFTIPVYAHNAAREEFVIGIDRWLEDGSSIGGVLTAVHLPGAAKGEIAIHSVAGKGIMLMGDALIHLEPYGFTFLPDKYCADAGLMKQSLRKLLQFSFEAMTFAHGLPVPSGARQRLEQLLQSS
jgi:glyoxylase-like metal-dependent hydrolase (beta-lactamase superfamily II)